MSSTQLIPARNKTGLSQAVRLCNESSICPFILDRQIDRTACLVIWKRKVLLWPCGKPGKARASNQQLKRAIKHGADALVLLASGTNIAGSTTFSSGQWRSNTTTTGDVYGNYFNAQSRTTGGGFGSSTTMPNPK